MDALQRMWPRGWWPDHRTLGLLIFGFFGVSAITVLVFSGVEISQLFNLQGPNEISYVPTWVRVGSGAALVGGVAQAIAALGGLALMASLPRARVVTASGVGVAAATVIVELVVEPFGAVGPHIASVMLDIAIVVLVMRPQPRRATGTYSLSRGMSAADSGAETPPAGRGPLYGG